MRNLFVVLAKLLGVFQVYWALTYLASISLFIGQTVTNDLTAQGMIVTQAIYICGYAVICFCMAWILMFKTIWLADKLHVPKESDQLSLSTDRVLPTGIKLVGVYILAVSLPGLLKALGETASFSLYNGSLAMVWTKILPAVLKVAMGLILTLRTPQTVRVISKGESTATKKLVFGAACILVFTIFLFRALPMRHSLPVRRLYTGAPDSESVVTRYAAAPSEGQPGNSDATFYSLKETNTDREAQWDTTNPPTAVHVEFIELE